MAPKRVCKNCNEPLNLEEGITSRRKFCSTKCRQESHRRVKAQRARAGARPLPDHIKQMKELINFHTGTGGEELVPLDIIRETFQDAVRENITQYVQDTVLGAVEIMAGMLPQALAALTKDIESHDAYERQRAYQILLKYLMPLHDKGGNDENLGQLTVVHKIPVPDTPLGAKYEQAVEELEVILPTDEDYPTCYVCKEHKHPDALRQHDKQGAVTRHICQSCYARKRFARGQDGAGLGGIDLEGTSFG